MESGLGLEKQNLDSGRGRTFFLTSLLIELIDSKEGCLCLSANRDLVHNLSITRVRLSDAECHFVLPFRIHQASERHSLTSHLDSNIRVRQHGFGTEFFLNLPLDLLFCFMVTESTLVGRR